MDQRIRPSPLSAHIIFLRDGSRVDVFGDALAPGPWVGLPSYDLRLTFALTTNSFERICSLHPDVAQLGAWLLFISSLLVLPSSGFLSYTIPTNSFISFHFSQFTIMSSIIDSGINSPPNTNSKSLRFHHQQSQMYIVCSTSLKYASHHRHLGCSALPILWRYLLKYS